jgi:signal peptidase
MYYVLKGDNNDVQDPYPIARNQIISKVVNIDSRPIIIPKIGYVSLWIQGIPKLFFKNTQITYLLND